MPVNDLKEMLRGVAEREADEGEYGASEHIDWMAADRIEKLEVENERLREHLSHVLRCRDDYGCSLCDDAHEALEQSE